LSYWSWPIGTTSIGRPARKTWAIRSDRPVVDDDARMREERAVRDIVVSLDANRQGIAGQKAIVAHQQDGTLA